MKMVKKFSETKTETVAYPEAEFFDAEAKRSLFNKELEFIDFTPMKSAKGDYAVVLAKNGSKVVSFSMGGVIFDQLKKLKDNKDLPVIAKMVERKAKQSGRLFMTLE
jgi:hypothetical protein